MPFNGYNGFELGTFEREDAQAVYDALAGISAPLTSRLIRTGGWRRDEIEPGAWERIVEQGLERSEVDQQVTFVDVRVPGATFIPALHIEFSRNRVLMFPQSSHAVTKWEEWTPRLVAEWLDAVVKLLELCPVLEVTMNVSAPQSNEDLFELWTTYWSWTQLGEA